MRSPVSSLLSLVWRATPKVRALATKALSCLLPTLADDPSVLSALDEEVRSCPGVRVPRVCAPGSLLSSHLLACTGRAHGGALIASFSLDKPACIRRTEEAEAALFALGEEGAGGAVVWVALRFTNICLPAFASFDPLLTPSLCNRGFSGTLVVGFAFAFLLVVPGGCRCQCFSRVNLHCRFRCSLLWFAGSRFPNLFFITCRDLLTVAATGPSLLAQALRAAIVDGFVVSPFTFYCCPPPYGTSREVRSQATPAIFEWLQASVLRGVNALTELDDMSRFSDAWVSIGAMVVAGGCPAPLTSGVIALDKKSGDPLHVVSRDPKATLVSVRVNRFGVCLYVCLCVLRVLHSRFATTSAQISSHGHSTDSIFYAHAFAQDGVQCVSVETGDFLSKNQLELELAPQMAPPSVFFPQEHDLGVCVAAAAAVFAQAQVSLRTRLCRPFDALITAEG